MQKPLLAKVDGVALYRVGKKLIQKFFSSTKKMYRNYILPSGITLQKASSKGSLLAHFDIPYTIRCDCLYSQCFWFCNGYNAIHVYLKPSIRMGQTWYIFVKSTYSLEDKTILKGVEDSDYSQIPVSHSYHIYFT